MGIIENIQNATIEPINNTVVFQNLTNTGSYFYIQTVVNNTTDGWAVFSVLVVLYFYGIYISSNNQNNNNTLDSWITVSLLHVIISIILFATGWLPGWQKILWGFLLYIFGLLFGYIVKPKIN